MIPLALERLKADAHAIYRQGDALPDYLTQNRPTFDADFFAEHRRLFALGGDWVVQPIREHLPLLGGAMAGARCELVFVEKQWESPLPEEFGEGLWLDLYLLIDGHLLTVRPYADFNDVETLGAEAFVWDRFQALPPMIANSLHRRVDGLHYTRTAPAGERNWYDWPLALSDMPVLPNGLDLMRRDRPRCKAMLRRLDAVTKGAASETALWRFQVLLDTSTRRHNDPRGDILIFDGSMPGSPIFHVKDQNFEQVRVLSRPGEDLDRHLHGILFGDGRRIEFEGVLL